MAGDTGVRGESLTPLGTGPGLELRQGGLVLCLKSKGNAFSRLRPRELNSEPQ